jgi:hypothetical protein
MPAKGRTAQGRTDELDEVPERDAWQPPQDVLYQDFPVIFDDDNRLFVRLATDGPQLADFCLIQQTRVGGEWKDVVRCDCAHGSVHAHFFRQDGSELRRTGIREIGGFEDVRAGYDAAYRRIVSKWEENLRRFI